MAGREDSYYDEHDGTEAMNSLLDELAVTERRLLDDRMRHEDAIRHIDSHLVNLMHMRDMLENNLPGYDASTDYYNESDQYNGGDSLPGNYVDQPTLNSPDDQANNNLVQAKIALAVSGYTEEEIDTIAAVAAAKIRYARSVAENESMAEKHIDYNGKENNNGSAYGINDINNNINNGNNGENVTSNSEEERKTNYSCDEAIINNDSDNRSVSDILLRETGFRDALDALDDDDENDTRNDPITDSISNNSNGIKPEHIGKDDRTLQETIDEEYVTRTAKESISSNKTCSNACLNRDESNARNRDGSASPTTIDGIKDLSPDENKLTDGVTDSARAAAAQAIEESRKKVAADCMPMTFGNEGISKSVRDTMNKVAEIINDEEITSMLGDESDSSNRYATEIINQEQAGFDLFDDADMQENIGINPFDGFVDDENSEIDNVFDAFLGSKATEDNNKEKNKTGNKKRQNTKETAEQIAREVINSMDNVKHNRKAKQSKKQGTKTNHVNKLSSSLSDGATSRAEQRAVGADGRSLEQKCPVTDMIASSLLISREVSQFLNETYDIPESEMSALYASYGEMFGDDDTGYKVPSFVTRSSKHGLDTKSPVSGMLTDDGEPLKQQTGDADTLEGIGISEKNLPRTGLLSIPSNAAGLITYKAPLEAIAIDVTNIENSSMLIECRDADIIEWDLGDILTESNIDIVAFWLNGVDEQSGAKCRVDWKKTGGLTVETIGTDRGVVDAMRGEDLFDDFSPIRSTRTSNGIAERLAARTAIEAVSNLPEMDVSTATLGIRFAGVIFMAHFFAGCSDIEISWQQPEHAKDGLLTGFFSELSESIADYGCVDGERVMVNHRTQAAWYADHAAAYDYIFIGRENDPFNRRLKQLGIGADGEILARVIEPAKRRTKKKN